MSSSKGDMARHSKAFLRAWLIQVTWTLESELPLQVFCQAYQLSKGKLLKKNELWSVSLNLIQRQLQSLAQVASKTFRPKPQYPVQWCNIMQHDAAILVLRCCLFKSTTHIRNWFSSAVHWYLHIIPWKWHKYKKTNTSLQHPDMCQSYPDSLQCCDPDVIQDTPQGGARLSHLLQPQHERTIESSHSRFAFLLILFLLKAV